MALKVQMISVTGNWTEDSPPSAGFTLIEVILVVGLAAIALSAMIVGFASVTDRGDALTAEETLFAAVRKARFIAASERTITQLRFDKESHCLQISLKNSEVVKSFELDDSFKEDRSAEIRFYLIPAAPGLTPEKDPVRTNLKTETVEFAPDRSSSPFVAEIDLGSDTPERLQFDPFSSLQVTSR